MKIRVYYEDVDIGGVVYHSYYLNFCERARSEKFFQNNLSPVDNEGHFFVKDIHASYKGSAKLGDELEVTSKLVKIGGASFVLHQEVLKDNEIIFELDITLVHVDNKNQIKKLSKDKKCLINNLFS